MRPCASRVKAMDFPEEWITLLSVIFRVLPVSVREHLQTVDLVNGQDTAVAQAQLVPVRIENLRIELIEELEHASLPEEGALHQKIHGLKSGQGGRGAVSGSKGKRHRGRRGRLWGRRLYIQS